MSKEFKVIYLGVECFAVWVDALRQTCAKVHFGNEIKLLTDDEFEVVV